MTVKVHKPAKHAHAAEDEVVTASHKAPKGEAHCVVCGGVFPAGAPCPTDGSPL